MFSRNKNLIISLCLSTLGTAYLIYYIFRGSTDVVASDYIRIINFYLEDVSDLHFLLSWEGIARIPFTFLARFVNVKLFRYSVYFDKILGTFGLFLFNTVVLSFALDYLRTKFARVLASILITYISFSLMSWEMILNGTGYVHFITVGLIALTFKIFANFIWTSMCKCENHLHSCCELSKQQSGKHFGITSISLFLCLLIIFTSILFAGSYTVSYNCTIIFFTIVFLVYVIISNKMFGVKREKNINHYLIYIYIIIPVICLLLYFKSNETGEPLIPVGFKDITLIGLLKSNPLFIVKFFLKSFASSVIGVETFDYALNFGTINEKIIFMIGFVYLLIIIYVIILLVYKTIKMLNVNVTEPANATEDKNVLCPLSLLIFIWMFIVYGIANYLLIFLARYKFVVDSYGMSSRYSIQYMFLTIGIVMTLIKYLDDFAKSCKGNILQTYVVSKYKFKNFIIIFISILSIFFITLGHLTTNTDEIFKADYRKIIYSIVEDKAKDYRNINDQDLEDTFEYRRGPEQIRKALETLEEQKLNVFREE